MGRRLVGLRRRSIAAVGWIAFAVGGGPRHASAQALPRDEITLRWNVRVPMRDGVTLSANLYLPAARRGRVPVILTMTPYGADAYHARARRFAEHGFAFVVIDVRGRGNSGGRYAPFERDGDDGVDAIAWLARQPWSTGRVGMWGGSYAGFVQWAVAARRPPALRTIVPAAAVHPGYDWPFLQGIRFISSAIWLAETSGQTANVEWGSDEAYWRAKTATLARDGRAFATFDQVIGLEGQAASLFQRWIAHPPGDPFWDRLTPTAAQYAAIRIPVLTITGSHDVDQPGALRFHAAHRTATRDGAPHVLLFGPWDHAGTRTPRATMRGLTFGAASVLDLDAMHREWYEWTLRDGPRPTWSDAAVRWYDAPDGAWHSAPSLAALADDTLQLIGRQAGAGTLAAPAALETAASTRGEHRLRYDPRDTLRLARDLMRDPASAIDTMRLAGWRDDGLVLASAPFETAMRLAGPVQLTARVHGDVPSADLSAELYLRTRDGVLSRLTMDLRRVPLDGTPRLVRFDAFPINLTQLPVGARFVLALAPVDRQLHEPDPWAGRRGAGTVVVTLGGADDLRLTVPVRRRAP